MAELTKFKYSPESVAGFFQQTKGIPEWAQRQLFDAQFQPTKEGELTQAIKALSDIRKEEGGIEKKKVELGLLGEFQKEQMRQAAPYKLLFEMPGQIMQSFTLPGQIRLAGAVTANQIVGQGLQGAAAIGAGGVPVYQRPVMQYF